MSCSLASCIRHYLIAEILLEVPDLREVAAGAAVAAPEAGGQRPGGAGVGVIIRDWRSALDTDRAGGGCALNSKCRDNDARGLR